MIMTKIVVACGACFCIYLLMDIWLYNIYERRTEKECEIVKEYLHDIEAQWREQNDRINYLWKKVGELERRCDGDGK